MPLSAPKLILLFSDLPLIYWEVRRQCKVENPLISDEGEQNTVNKTEKQKEINVLEFFLKKTC